MLKFRDTAPSSITRFVCIFDFKAHALSWKNIQQIVGELFQPRPTYFKKIFIYISLVQLI